MDLNSINANINRLLTNIWAVISFLKEFAVDGAKDVSIIYINADGSESVSTFPNIAKFYGDADSKYLNKNINQTISGELTISQNSPTPLKIKRNSDSNINIAFEGITLLKYFGIADDGKLKFGDDLNLSAEGHNVWTDEDAYSGSNSNGSYIKFPNGTLICLSKKYFTDIEINNIDAGGLYRNTSGAIETVFPLPFVGIPFVTVSSSGNASLNAFAMSVYSTSEVKSQIIAWRNDGATVEVAYDLIAIGRWK